jgi:hypothetical protein
VDRQCNGQEYLKQGPANRKGAGVGKGSIVMGLVMSILSLIVSAIAVFITYVLFRRAQIANIMPVLVFTRRSEAVWQIENVGRGPALSVAVGDKEESGKWRWSVRCYPIAAGAAIQVPLPSPGDELMTSYKDIKGNAHSTLCSMSENVFYEENRFPDLKPSIDEYSLAAMIERYRRMF